ncbi:hypothetical protein CHARACLAT_002087 [Characodon lateralis]|uniref:Uncharacterized protein n=1 Tax=Characodon lateralis TaxID=208331 RepID=A0ABU7EZI6_9TELE|nr:hypothetical protein [Characodon lateralis]
MFNPVIFSGSMHFLKTSSDSCRLFVTTVFGLSHSAGFRFNTRINIYCSAERLRFDPTHAVLDHMITPSCKLLCVFVGKLEQCYTVYIYAHVLLREFFLRGEGISGLFPYR